MRPCVARQLAAWRQRLSPLAITMIGLCCMLGLGVADYFTPGPWSFVMFYMLLEVGIKSLLFLWYYLLRLVLLESTNIRLFREKKKG